MNEMIIKEAAIKEVLDPTFELTKQFLHVHELVYKDGMPFIEDVFMNEVENKAAVYFPVKDESFYFVVYICTEDGFEPLWMEMSPGNIVELVVVSENHSLDWMLEKINFKPQRQWKKGERKRFTHSVVYDHSGFVFSLETRKTGELEEKLKQLITFLIQRKESIVTLSDIATVEISITYYGYKDQMWGIHLEKDIIKKMSELNITLDVDLYASGKDLNE